MGKVISIKSLKNNKICMNLELTSKEALWLKGNLDKMHLFSENNLKYGTRLIKRGKRESSKYFLLPKELREDILPSNEVLCNNIKTKTKNLIIFAVPTKEN